MTKPRFNGSVYGLYDPISEELRYVGQTTRTLRRRLAQHCGTQARLLQIPVGRWVAKLHESGLRPEIRALHLDLDTKAALDACEIEEIAKQRQLLGTKLLNVGAGGEGGSGPRSLDSRRRMSEKMMGHSVSEETRRLCSINAAARRPEVKAKISASRKGRPIPHDVRAKISASLVGRKFSDKTRTKMGTASVARWNDPALRERMLCAGPKHHNFRQDIDTDKIGRLKAKGETPKQIAEKIGVSPAFVRRRLRSLTTV